MATAAGAEAGGLCLKYVTALADFKSAIGSLTVFLVLTTYVFTTSAISLVGVQFDEVLRKQAD